jgi:hypothetical protein
MARGLRRETLDRVMEARKRLPMSLGPYLGELSVRANVAASTVANIIGAHEQTVFRWFFGQSEVQPVWAAKVSQLVALLAWMHNTKRVPLDGTYQERMKLLEHHTAEFRSLVRGQSQQAAA